MPRAMLLMSAVLAVTACAPIASVPSEPVLYVYRDDLPAFLQLNDAWDAIREIPFAVPPGCEMAGTHAAPRGPRLAIELNCGFGPAVVLLDVDSGEFTQPITDADSHLLAWAADSQALYLRINSINRPQIIRWNLNGRRDPLPIDELTYDLAPAPSGGNFLFSYSHGMGQGSEMWLARNDGGALKKLASDSANYLALARWSPDGKQVAFIKIPDSATPFTVGELWTMSADGSAMRKIANADAGHGFAPAWSSDGTRIAFVARENPGDPSADVSSDALISNLQVAEIDTGRVTPITNFSGVRVQAPAWKPGADVILFSARQDDRMAVYALDLLAVSMQRVPIESICCAVWLRE